MAITGSHAVGFRKTRRRLCGVPPHECRGALIQLSPGLTSGLKSHATPEEAFGCYRAWLLRLGYRQVGSREFESPADGRIILLTRKRRFGAVLRGGKEGRHMPGQFPGGTIVC
ncbi:MAG: hypothetical protein IT429_24480 [Gemmataceae bacterium]|nr:hypothetical protein [Gemmataceae bacterium]